MIDPFEIGQGDQLPVYTATLRGPDGQPLNLTGCSVEFNMRLRGATALTVNGGCYLVDATTGRVAYYWQAGDTDVPGAYDAEFRVQDSGGDVQTIPPVDKLEVVIGASVEAGQGAGFPDPAPIGGSAAWFSVAEYGAVGDGSTDDTAAFQAAIDAAETAGNGVVLIPPATYRLASGITVDTADRAIIDIVAWGATVNFEGSGVGLTITDTDLSEYNRGAHVHGGMWQGTTSGVLGNTSIGSIIRVQDIVSATFVGVWVRGASNGNALQVRNLDYWTEQVTALGCKFSHSARCVDFEPASVTGGAGTESFARARFDDCVFSGGASGGYLLNLSGDVYGSSFTNCGGNVNPGANVYRLNGGHLGTVIADNDFEGGNASSKVFVVGPDIGANYPRVSNIRVDLTSSMSLTSDSQISDAHTFEAPGIAVGLTPASNGQVRIPFGSASTDGIFARNPDNNGDVQIVRAGGSSGNVVLYMSTDGWPVSFGSTAAASGHLRVPNDKALVARNNADSGDVEVLRVDTSDLINLGTFGANVRVGGDLYPANNKAVSWRNQADSGYVEAVRVNTSNQIVLAGAQSPLVVGVSGGEVGFYGATPGTKPTVTGARNSPEAALASLLSTLATLGLIVDSTTAT